MKIKWGVLLIGIVLLVCSCKQKDKYFYILNFSEEMASRIIAGEYNDLDIAFDEDHGKDENVSILYKKIDDPKGTKWIYIIESFFIKTNNNE